MKTTTPVSMTERDYQRLLSHQEQHQAQSRGMLPLLSIFCIVIGLVMLFMTADAADGFGLILGIPTALGCGWFAWIGFSIWSNHENVAELIRQDAEHRKKIVVEGSIIQKREEHYKYSASYYLKMEDGEYSVDVSHYTRCDEGNTVRLHLSEKAKLPLDLEKLI